MPETGTPRWERRAAGARALRVVVFCGPIVASVVAAWVARELMPPPVGRLGQAASLLSLIAVSTAVLMLVDRFSRRALPLATLLDLNMLFPDRAPSRLAMAREAIRHRPIEEQLQRVKDAGADPGAVAREILTLVAALSAHDRPTRGHAERVRMFTDLLAAQLRLPQHDRDLLRWAAILHDVGKLRVPAGLLNKPGKPTREEWAQLRAHPAHGAEMAGPLLPWLGEWGDVIVQHHERFDGTGYPNGLAGADISLGARIVSVADAYDVMTAARAYKRPVSRTAALRELVRFSGSQFDPLVVRAMVDAGAPRLRAAQGLVAWLADVPLVATNVVPVATVARVVGASALATGAVAGAVPAMPAPTPTDLAAVHAGGTDERGARPVRRDAAEVSTLARPGGTGNPRQPGPAAADPGPAKRPGAHEGAASEEPATSAHDEDDDSGHGTGSSGPGSSRSGSDSGSSGSGSGSSGPSDGEDPPEDSLDPVAEPVEAVVDLVDTADEVVADPSGTVTEILDPDDSGSGPSGSGSSGSGGGLLPDLPAL